MLRPIAALIDRLRRPETTQQPAISETDLRLLELLRSKPEYAAFIRALDARVTLEADRFLSSHDPYRDTLSKGILIGLRNAGTLVDEILTQRHHATEAERRRLDAAERPSDQRARTRALYGSPAWGRTIHK